MIVISRAYAQKVSIVSTDYSIYTSFIDKLDYMKTHIERGKERE